MTIQSLAAAAISRPCVRLRHCANCGDVSELFQSRALWRGEEVCEKCIGREEELANTLHELWDLEKQRKEASDAISEAEKSYRLADDKISDLTGKLVQLSAEEAQTIIDNMDPSDSALHALFAAVKSEQ